MPAGRKPNSIAYTTKVLNGQSYIIGSVYYNDTSIQFVCNADDYDSINKHQWHAVGGKYIGHNFTDPETKKRKVLYLHNLIMDRNGNGKGQHITVDHINGIGFDNRRENLREVSQSIQNRNTRDRARKTDRLPTDISPSEIPRNVWYMPSNGHHSDRFVIEFKGIPGIDDIEVKTTSSKENF